MRSPWKTIARLISSLSVSCDGPWLIHVGPDAVRGLLRVRGRRSKSRWKGDVAQRDQTDGKSKKGPKEGAKSNGQDDCQGTSSAMRWADETPPIGMEPLGNQTKNLRDPIHETSSLDLEQEPQVIIDLTKAGYLSKETIENLFEDCFASLSTKVIHGTWTSSRARRSCYDPRPLPTPAWRSCVMLHEELIAWVGDAWGDQIGGCSQTIAAWKKKHSTVAVVVLVVIFSDAPWSPCLCHLNILATGLFSSFAFSQTGSATFIYCMLEYVGRGGAWKENPIIFNLGLMTSLWNLDHQTYCQNLFRWWPK